jgi:hypothetical protein
MKHTALALALGAVCTLNAQTLFFGQTVQLGDVLGSTDAGAHIQYAEGSVTVSLGKITSPHPIYGEGAGWIARVGVNNHLILALQPVGQAWGGTFTIPQALPFFSFELEPASYFLTISVGGYPTLDVNDTVVLYRSSVFAFGGAPPVGPGPGPGLIVPGEDPVVIPPLHPGVPEPGAWALLTALFLAGFAGYRRL